MIDHLIRAAREAREQSSGERIIDIVVTELGFIVRGRGKSRGLVPIQHSVDLPWSQFDQSPELLTNAVRLTGRELDRQA